MGDEVIHQLQHGVGGIYRIHVVELDHVARPVQDVVGHGVIVEPYVYQMHAGVDQGGQHKRGGNVDQLLLGQLQRKHQNRDAEFQRVREIVEEEGPGEDLKVCLRLVQHQRNQRTDAPQKKQVVDHLASGGNCDGKQHGRDRAHMEGQILDGRAPGDQIEDDGCDAGKR